MTAVQTSSLESFLQLISVLVIFVVVLGITYIATRWIAGYQKEHSFNKNLRIVETLKITTNKYIQIIEAGEEFLVIAIGKDEVQLLTKLTKDQLKEFPAKDFSVGTGAESFKELFERLKEEVKEHMPKK